MFTSAMIGRRYAHQKLGSSSSSARRRAVYAILGGCIIASRVRDRRGGAIGAGLLPVVMAATRRLRRPLLAKTASPAFASLNESYHTDPDLSIRKLEFRNHPHY